MSPVLETPAEVWLQIFIEVILLYPHGLTFAVNTPEPCITVKLSWVCRFWRSILQTSSQPWSSMFLPEAEEIDLHGGMVHLVDMYLRLSQQAPLTIFFEPRFNAGKYSDQVFNLVVNNLPRVQTLYFINYHNRLESFEEAVITSLIERQLEDYPVRFPILKTLGVFLQRGRSTPVFEHLWKVFTSCPSLMTFHPTFSYTSDSLHMSDLSNIRHFRGSFSFVRALHIWLARMPKLETLCLDAPVVNHWRIFGPSSCTAHNLVELSIFTTESTGGWFNIHLPSLTKLSLSRIPPEHRIQWTPLHSIFCTEICEMLVLSGAKLQFLVVDNIPGIDIEALLRMQPTITSLMVSMNANCIGEAEDGYIRSLLELLETLSRIEPATEIPSIAPCLSKLGIQAVFVGDYLETIALAKAIKNLLSVRNLEEFNTRGRYSYSLVE
ncbi:hypothetical protein F5879DRAFT_991005 [Lentinula edodes]|uniref:uncharacterized protein n=1 Tax=Lentinula edodes TaxID=5353 RepID=UPI001E8EEFAC|nr:uncharacterized protein C8R40DRAFT_1175933 [Lentinula edodes]KAH7870242.1 hypothetical protein C8R40DRAFT_1175933 [Lentinula edodes]KAJ3902462.1 hypothetical protein F5879DRAFT_991005 [Lentinula edodes]